MNVEKGIRFVFRKDILLENHVIICDELKEILATINDECELLLHDNLARGRMAESASTMAWCSAGSEGAEGKWNYQYQTLEQKYLPSHLDEYWGQLATTLDVVAGAKGIHGCLLILRQPKHGWTKRLTNKSISRSKLWGKP